MKHYRVYKLRDPRGSIVRAKDLHASSDAEAMHQACEDPDCPVCEIWQGTKKVGTIE